MKRIIISGTIILVGIALWFLSVVLPVSGKFQTLEPMLVGSCSSLDVFPGTEDVAIDVDTRLVFISASDRRGDTGGGIFVTHLDNPVSVARVSPTELTDFHPHGISLWHGETSETRLFVINHKSTGEHIVEIFGIGAGGTLTHLESISFEAMHSPNDLVAVGPRQFYATNDRGYRGGLLGTLEQYFALPFSSAVYYDGTEGRQIRKGLVSANGINRSLDGRTIYIAELLKRRISVFDRDIETGELSKRGSIKVNTAPDNIDIDPDGTLWVAGHTKVFEFLAHASDAAEIAPSHVIRIDAASKSVEDVFISVDGEINGASVGAVSGNTLIVGAVFDGHVMVCPLP